MYGDHPHSRRQRPGSSSRPGGGVHRSSSHGNSPYTTARASPYSRPGPGSRTPSSAQAAPQQQQQQSQSSQLSIRGASSIPTQVLVSNLAEGTTSEDIRQTFLQFGDIIRVRPRRSNTGGQVAYEVLFEERKGALKAVEQLNGALADGRILAVVIEEDNSVVKPQSQPATPLSSDIPTGPRSQQSSSQSNGNHQPRGNGRNNVPATAPPTGPSSSSTSNRKRDTRQPLPKATEKKQPLSKQSLGKNSLQSRLGGLPLAQRLSSLDKSAAKSDISALASNKNKKAAKNAKNVTTTTNASTGAATPSRSKIQREKRKAKAAAAAAAAAAGAQGADADAEMQMD
ncbi:unnamed protein product [Sympodiomycopsis kandeliae]